MSESRLTNLRQEARTNPGDLNSWLHLEAALIRSGESGAETFAPARAILSDAFKAARAACDALKDARQAASTKAYVAQLTTDWVCFSCRGRGYHMVHVHSGNAWLDDGRRDCQACGEGAPRPIRESRKHDGALERKCMDEARVQFLSELDEAQDRVSEAYDALAPYEKALEVEKGARVVYANKRARARFTFCKPEYHLAEGCGACAEDGAKVPTNTQGELFWVSEFDSKVGVKTDSGATFFTSTANLGSEALNGWDRLHGLDSRTQFLAAKKAEEEAAMATDEDKILATFGRATPQRGDVCVLNGTGGKVFWIGTTRQGRVRIGIKDRLTSRTDPATWGLAADATRPVVSA